MKLLVIFLIIVAIILFILVIKKFFLTETMINNKFDNVILPGDLNKKVNIGIGTNPSNDAFLNIDGDIVVKDRLWIGNTYLDYDTVKKLNKLPLFTEDKYCLQDSDGNDHCVTEDQLQMLTGERNIIFNDANNNAFEPYSVSHHGRSRCTAFGLGHHGMDGDEHGGFEIFDDPYPHCPPGRGNKDCQGYYGCMPGGAAAHAVCAHPSNGSAGGDCPAYDHGHYVGGFLGLGAYCPGPKWWYCGGKPDGYNLYHDKGKTHLETFKKAPLDKNSKKQQFSLNMSNSPLPDDLKFKCYPI